MTTVELLSIVCRWINEKLGYKAIQGPSNNPAPKGRYISVVMQNVRQVGDIMVPGPRSEDGTTNKYKTAVKVASIQLYEVEGDGDWLRNIQNGLQSDEFCEFVEKNSPELDGLDTGFSVWEIGDIVDNGFQDGTFYFQQKTMSFDAQFHDYLEHRTQRMERIEVNLNNEENLSVEVENG